MNKKQLAEMIKEMRAKKLSEQVGEVRQKSNTSVGPTPGTGSRFAPKDIPFQNTIGAVEKRTWQKSGNQARSPESYVAEEGDKETELGDTDTGEKTKKKTETIDVNPTMKDVAGGGLTTTKGTITK